MKYKRILFIPDLHTPFHHIDAFKFLDSIINKIRPDKIVLGGDEIDNHAMVFDDADAMSPGKELDQAIYSLKDLGLIAPRVTILGSNHSNRLYNKAKANKISKRALKPYLELIEAPTNWDMTDELILTMSNNKQVYMCHNLCTDVIDASMHKMMNFIQCHYHTRLEAQYWANHTGKYWGVTSGCLVDQDAYSMKYAKKFKKMFMLGVTVIVDGEPILIPMPLKKRRGKLRWNGKTLLDNFNTI